MNSTQTNSGGWASSQIRTNICGTSLSDYSGTIIAVIPETLRAVLKPVTKYTDNTGNGGTTASAVTATVDYFFLLSEYEIFGRVVYSNRNETSKQARYEYYSAGNSMLKYRHDVTTTSVYWLTRTPDQEKTTRFEISANANPGAANANYSFGFAPGFCV